MHATNYKNVTYFMKYVYFFVILMNYQPLESLKNSFWILLFIPETNEKLNIGLLFTPLISVLVPEVFICWG